MKENISMGTAVLAIVISIIAIASTVIVKPVSTIGASSVGENELADNSVTSSKVVDGALTDDDISDTGISKIADDSIISDQIVSNSIMLQDLNSEVVAAMTGVVDIANNSITGEKLVNGTITNVHISDSAAIAPSKIDGTAWTSDNDGSGSGLDADTVDGLHGNQFLRSDTSSAIDGDLVINGELTWQTKTSYMSISTAAFVPREDGYDYYNNGAYIENMDGNSDNYYAPVQLPHGATVTNMTFYWKDYSSNNGLLTLAKRPLLSAILTMASAETSGSSDTGSSYDNTIEYAVIDNSHNCYYLGLYLYDTNIECYGVIIEYTFTEPY